MVNENELLGNLNDFYGTTEYFKLYPNVMITEGVKYLMDEAKCYWIAGIVWSYQTIKKVSNEPFQVYKLKVDLKKKEGVMTCEDGNGKVLHRQTILTDFPVSQITLYYEGTVLMLTSEH